MLDWLAGFSDDRWPIPSVGPAFGRALDQACLVRRHSFRCVMALPCADPRDALGIEAGLREIAEAAGIPLIIYIKSEDGFGADIERGLDAIGRLMTDGVGVAIKYAIVRDDPSRDPYLDGLLRRVDRSRVISGMGERPAIVHLRDFGLVGAHDRIRLHRAAALPRPQASVSRTQLDRSGSDPLTLHAARGPARRMGSRPGAPPCHGVGWASRRPDRSSPSSPRSTGGSSTSFGRSRARLREFEG